MRRRGLAPIAVAAALVLLGGVSEDLIGQLSQLTAAKLDPDLPEKPFVEWLRSLLPPGVAPVYRRQPCSDGEAECLVVECNVASRARTARLEFDTEKLSFRGGRVESPDAERPLPVESLAELPDRLQERIRMQPPDCPEGARPILREEPEAVRFWCENADGERHGPAVSWHDPGRRLKARGSYDAGERVGRWVECDRDERCRTKDYGSE